jgi:hypothetical protein
VVLIVIVSTVHGQRLSEEYLQHLKEAVNAAENPVEYLAIDPGKTNGVCGYDTKYYLQFMLTIDADDMIRFLQQFNFIKKCIYEGYMVYPNKMKEHVYTDLQTSRVIGRIESWGELKQIELIKQPASIKSTGYKWIDEKPLPKSNKKNHCLDAHVHFMYWAVKHGLINAADLLRRRVPHTP